LILRIRSPPVAVGGKPSSRKCATWCRSGYTAVGGRQGLIIGCSPSRTLISSRA
jgi:hypothetical protein